MRCTGSMYGLSRPTASDWASASACWNLVVSLSIRISYPVRKRFGFAPKWGCKSPNSTVFPTLSAKSPFPPNQGGLPAGGSVAPVRVVQIRAREGALRASVNAAHTEFFQTPPGESRQIRHETSARVRSERLDRLRVGTHECLSHLGSHSKVVRPDARSEPCHEIASARFQGTDSRLDDACR